MRPLIFKVKLHNLFAKKANMRLPRHSNHLKENIFSFFFHYSILTYYL